MKAGVVIKLPDGRIGTLCYSNLDGEGGAYGASMISHTSRSDLMTSGQSRSSFCVSHSQGPGGGVSGLNMRC